MRLIDADELITRIRRNHMAYCGMSRQDALSAIENSATIEPKKGKWIPKPTTTDFIICSSCKNEAYWDTDYGQQLFEYCPYCGADMRGIKHETN